jgi:hypothetical protein
LRIPIRGWSAVRVLLRRQLLPPRVDPPADRLALRDFLLDIGAAT